MADVRYLAPVFDPEPVSLAGGVGFSGRSHRLAEAAISLSRARFSRLWLGCPAKLQYGAVRPRT